MTSFRTIFKTSGFAFVMALAPTQGIAQTGGQSTTTLAAANTKAAIAQSELNPGGAQIQMPPPEAMIIMIRSSLVALSQANVTNNYQVLNALGSENFRAANPPARLAQIFAPFRSNNIDLTPVVFVTPQLSQQPQIKDGKLRMVGIFPTQPMQVAYDLQFEPSGGTWKLFGISVNLNPAAQPSQNGQQSR
jgi:hypothetical protein